MNCEESIAEDFLDPVDFGPLVIASSLEIRLVGGSIKGRVQVGGCFYICCSAIDK